MAGKPWTQVGTIRQSEAGKLYIKFHGDKDKEGKFSVKCLEEFAARISDAGADGLSLQIEKPEDKLDRLASLGFIKDEDLERRKEAVPSYIKYEITLPPARD